MYMYVDVLFESCYDHVRSRCSQGMRPTLLEETNWTTMLGEKHVLLRTCSLIGMKR